MLMFYLFKKLFHWNSVQNAARFKVKNYYSVTTPAFEINQNRYQALFWGGGGEVVHKHQEIKLVDSTVRSNVSLLKRCENRS